MKRIFYVVISIGVCASCARLIVVRPDEVAYHNDRNWSILSKPDNERLKKDKRSTTPRR